MVNHRGVTELKKQLELSEERNSNPDSSLYKLANHILESPVLKINQKTGDFNPRFLGIIPTRACNGACNYCDFSADRAPLNTMSLKMAASIVVALVDQADPGRQYLASHRLRILAD